MVDFIKSLFTPEQWARLMGWLIDTGLHLLDNGLLVLWVVFLIFATTQIVKISWRRSPIKGPPDWGIHAVSVISAGAWSWSQLKAQVFDTRIAMAVVAWFITWLIVTYGGSLLRAYRPGIWSAVNLDRRREDLGPPPEAGPRRKEDTKP